MLYLKCTCDADTYQKEIGRLSDIQRILVDEENYNGNEYFSLYEDQMLSELKYWPQSLTF